MVITTALASCLSQIFQRIALAILLLKESDQITALKTSKEGYKVLFGKNCEPLL